MPRPSILIAVLALGAAAVCAVAGALPAGSAIDRRDGGEVERGRMLFEQRWSAAPSGFGRWGRGPVSNGEACSDCHAQGRRGALPVSADEPLRQGVVRLSQRVGPLLLPHRAYGEQLQYQGVLGRVPGEGEVHVDWIEHAVTLGDGVRVTLRRPLLRAVGLVFGELEADTVLSLRLAPALAGVGLLEQVDDALLRARAAAQGAAEVSGRIALVADAGGGAPRVGRFGHKASQPTLHAQAAKALFADLGVTSALHPEHVCPPVQWECIAHATTAAPEIGDQDLAHLVRYLRSIAAPFSLPAPRREHQAGARLFAEAGCSACHADALPVTGGGEPVRAYTDLLLHDLGAGLDDDRPEADAHGREWRTAPLWGLAGHPTGTPRVLLHDGRARSVAEAIMWHDGEARGARRAFARMRETQRNALVAFVESL